MAFPPTMGRQPTRVAGWLRLSLSFLVSVLPVYPAEETPRAEAPALPSITCVPADSDVVMYADLQWAIRHPVAVKFFNKNVAAEDRQRLSGIAQLLGLNIQEDLDALVLFGSSMAVDKMTVAVLGTFRPARLGAAASLAADYKRMDVAGQTIHCLPQSAKKYITFLGDHLMVAGDDLASLGKTISAAKSDDPTFAALAAKYLTLPHGKKPLAWVFARNPDFKPLHLPGALGQATAEALSFSLVEDGGGVTVDGWMRIQQPDLTQQVVSALQGILTVAQMAGNDSAARRALAGIQIVQGEDQNTVKLHLHLRTETLEALLGNGKKHENGLQGSKLLSDVETSPAATAVNPARSSEPGR